MSRITVDTKCRLCKAARKKLYLKGSRCFSAKCPIDKKGAVRPGMHGLKSEKKPSDYRLQLRAKQEVKRLYGLNETQFKNLYLKAKGLSGLIGDNLIRLLERRLDNVVYLAGFALSRSHARQLISHRHILVNDRPVSIASYLVNPQDQIALDQEITTLFSDQLRYQAKDFESKDWFKLDQLKPAVTITSHPDPAVATQGLDLNLIIEYYSR